MSAVTLRQARPDDIDALERLENAAFDGDRLSRRSLRRYIAAPSALMLVAESGGMFAGYALVGLRRGGRSASVWSLAVDAAMAGRGVGRALMQGAQARCAALGREAMRLEVRADNAGAIALYERLGYERSGVIADYYEDGQSAISMRKALQRG